MLLRFVDGFDRFLRERQLYLDLGTYRLHGNVKRRDDDLPLLDVEVTALLEEYRQDLDSLEAVDGAIEALRRIEPYADIAVLSNVSVAQGPARQRNLASHGLHYPLVCNSGPKGPAVKELSARAGDPVFFVDDIGPHLKSVAEFAPGVVRIHLVGDERLKAILPASEHADLRAENWDHAARFMLARLEEGT